MFDAEIDQSRKMFSHSIFIFITEVHKKIIVFGYPLFVYFWS